MKKTLLIALALTAGVSSVQGQTMREKMEAKMAEKMGLLQKTKKVKIAEPHEGEFSDASGISGTYYTASELIFNEKSIKIAKIDYDDERKLTLHLSKEDLLEFSMFDWSLYAKNNYNHYEFDHNRSLKLYNVEPGVLILGVSKRDGYGFIADTAKFKPVILVKDSTKMGSYTYEDAQRIMAEGTTKQEKYNRERLAESTQMAGVGNLTSNKELMNAAWKTIESALAQKSDWAGERDNYQMHYIYEDKWANLASSKVYNPGTKSYEWTRKMISVLVVFREPNRDELTYYSFVISKPADDADDNYRGFTFNGNSRKLVVTKKTVDEKKAEVAKL